MAYTIISQNNSTTTLSDGVNTITVPSRVNLTSGNFTIVEVNNNMATLEDGDGNVYRDIPCVATLVDAGGGGGAVSSVNGQTGAVVLNAEDVGAVPQYSTMPTADSTNAGEIVQFTGATDATYTHGYIYECVSDGGNPATYSWTAVSVQAGGGSSLPSQTGNSGKFLTTDGTDASWAAISALQNTATNNSSLTILGYASSDSYSINIGQGSQGNASGIAIGYGARNFGSGYSGRVAIGHGAYTSNGAYSIAIGYYAKTGAANAIQLNASSTSHTNSDANTFKVANDNGNYEIMSADGTIPTARLTNAINKYSSMPTASADYLGQIAQFTGTTDATYTHGYIYECVSDGGNPATYSWTAVSVQAGGGSSLPSQTGNAGKFLTTDGTDASWSDKPLVNRATGYHSLVLNINPNATSTDLDGNNNVMVGFGSKVQSTSSNYNTLIGYGAITGSGNRTENIAIGRSVTASANKSIVIGQNSSVTADYAIQLGNNGYNVALNPDANTFKVANANGNYEIMSADGTIPAARHASLPAADGTYVLKLVIASGVPTLSWVAE